jgi:flagellar basal body L-ring protein FlgH
VCQEGQDKVMRCQWRGDNNTEGSSKLQRSNSMSLLLGVTFASVLPGSDMYRSRSAVSETKMERVEYVNDG